MISRAVRLLFGWFTYADAKGCRAVAAAAAASGPGFLARASAALAGKAALAAPTRPRCIETPLNAAAVTNMPQWPTL